MISIDTMTVQEARAIRWVLTDIDDTLTKDGKLLSESYAALWTLFQNEIPVIAVTGRAAAWGNLLCHEWPVSGVIAENGAIAYFITKGRHIETLPFPGAQRNTHPALQAALAQTMREIPRAKPAEDTYLRLYDIAVDYAENVVPPLSHEEVTRIIEIFKSHDCQAQASSIHVNTWKGEFDKKKASELFLQQRYGYSEKDASAILYVGDAANDETMFEFFPQSCGVANIINHAPYMRFLPKWISHKSYGKGFAEIVDMFISKRNQPNP